MVAQFNPKVSNFKGKLHPDLIEQIQELKISDIATKWGIAIKKRGAGFVTSCPFHKEKTPSLSLTDGAGFYCFGCGEKGGNIKFISKLENCSTTEASIMIAEAFNLNIKVEDGNSDRHFHLKSVKPKYQKRVDAVTVKLARLESPAADSPQAEIASEVRAAIKKELEANEEVEQIVYHYSRTQRVYRYQNPDTGRKTFRQWSHNPNGGNSWGKGDQPWLAYRLKEASEALATGGNALLVQEGEKCVEIARGIGLANITFQGSCWDEKDIRRSLGGLLVSCPDFILVVLTDTGDAGEKKGKILKATAHSMGLRVVAISADQLVEDLENNSDIEQVLARLSPGQFIEQLEKLAAETISSGGDEPPKSGDGGSDDGGDDGNYHNPVALARKLEEARAVIGDRIKFNEMLGFYEVDGECLKFEDLRLTLATAFNLDLRIGERQVNIEDLKSIVREIGLKNSYNPIKDYLLDCHSKYKSTEILQDAALRYFGCKNPIYNTLFQKFLIGAVARIFEPGCKNDCALILQSPQQGLYKSTFFRILAGDDYFSDDMSPKLDKDDLLKLHMNWIVEWGELEFMIGRTENSRIKQFLACKSDLIRVPYAITTERVKRHTVIVGSTNETEFLSDPTGSRRFWVIPVRQEIPIDLLIQERDQLWAAATELYLQGTPWWLSKDEQQNSNSNNSEFMIGSSWEERILEILQGVDQISTRELLIGLDVNFSDPVMVKKIEQQLRFAMGSLGYTPARVRVEGMQVRGYKRGGAVTGGPSHPSNDYEQGDTAKIDLNLQGGPSQGPSHPSNDYTEIDSEKSVTSVTANFKDLEMGDDQLIKTSGNLGFTQSGVTAVTKLPESPIHNPSEGVTAPPKVPSQTVSKIPEHYMSFGYTAKELIAGKKSVTRRSWKTNYVQKILNRFYQGLTIYPAFDCDPNKYPEAQQLGWVRLTQKPYQERLIDMPESDLIAEGGMSDTKEAFINKYFKGEAQKSVWVIRFEFIPFIADTRDFMPVGHYESTPAYKCAQKWVHDTRQGILSLSEAFERWNYLRDVEKAIVCRAIVEEHPQVMAALKRLEG